MREALFNILGHEISGARLVDLFAGAGTVGFEALSRGAEHVTFVDSDPRAVQLVHESAVLLGCEDRCSVVRADALAWTRRRPPELARATAVFLDAPYRDDVVDSVLAALGEAPPPLVVCEHHRARVLPGRPGRLVVVRRAHYGISDLSILRPADTEAHR